MQKYASHNYVIYALYGSTILHHNCMSKGENKTLITYEAFFPMYHKKLSTIIKPVSTLTDSNVMVNLLIHRT